MATELKIDQAKHGDVRSWIKIYDGQNLGYAKNTREELQYISDVAQTSGVVLDSVYAGKALYHFMKNVVPGAPEVFRPYERILFVHTGGVFGLYDKEAQLIPVLNGGGDEAKAAFAAL